jgi:hypothetical protein
MRFFESRHPEVRGAMQSPRASKGDGVRGYPSRPSFGRRLRMTAVCVALLTTAAHAADDVVVDVQNASTPTLCAEEDNVYVKLASPEVRNFKVEAVHPNYIGTIVVDR